MRKLLILLFFISVPTTYAGPANIATLSTDCLVLGGARVQYHIYTEGSNELFDYQFGQYGLGLNAGFLVDLPGNYQLLRFSLTPPKVPFLLPQKTPDGTINWGPGITGSTAEPEMSAGTSQLVYAIFGANTLGEVCIYSYRITFDGQYRTRDNFNIFTPLSTGGGVSDPLIILLLLLCFLPYLRRRFTKIYGS